MIQPNLIEMPVSLPPDYALRYPSAGAIWLKQ
jgi:hypothetical protein